MDNKYIYDKIDDIRYSLSGLEREVCSCQKVDGYFFEMNKYLYSLEECLNSALKSNSPHDEDNWYTYLRGLESKHPIEVD